jgi:hypothetical protein
VPEKKSQLQRIQSLQDLTLHKDLTVNLPKDVVAVAALTASIPRSSHWYHMQRRLLRPNRLQLAGADEAVHHLTKVYADRIQSLCQDLHKMGLAAPSQSVTEHDYLGVRAVMRVSVDAGGRYDVDAVIALHG